MCTRRSTIPRSDTSVCGITTRVIFSIMWGWTGPPPPPTPDPTAGERLRGSFIGIITLCKEMPLAATAVTVMLLLLAVLHTTATGRGEAEMLELKLVRGVPRRRACLTDTCSVILRKLKLIVLGDGIFENKELQTPEEVRAPPKRPHHLSVKAVDWEAEAMQISHCEPFQFGSIPCASVRTDITAPAAYVITGHNHALWTRATEAERRCVVEAFATNTTVQRVEMVNALVTDALGQAWGGVLSRNSSITALNLESNSISSG